MKTKKILRFFLHNSTNFKQSRQMQFLRYFQMFKFATLLRTVCIYWSAALHFWFEKILKILKIENLIFSKNKSLLIFFSDFIEIGFQWKVAISVALKTYQLRGNYGILEYMAKWSKNNKFIKNSLQFLRYF